MKRLCCAAALLIAGSLSALAVEKSQTIVYINGAKYYIHTVQPGETLYSLSKAYQVGEQVIVENNPSIADGLKAAGNIKIPVVADVSQQPVSEKKLRKTFDRHVVSQGETLYAISRRYEVPVQTLIADNPELDPTQLHPGDRLLIRRREIGTEDAAGTQAQWEEYRDKLNSVSGDSVAYHIVNPGETFYSLSHRFGITEEELGRLNGGLRAADLKAGAMIRIPGEARTEVAEQQPAAEVQPPQQQAPQLDFRALSASEPLKAALLLPLSTGDEPNANFVEFYQGFLLGLDSVKTRYGRSVDLTLYNTGRSAERVREIVGSDAFVDTRLIVGPVYEEELYPAIRFGEEYGVPVVSPLAHDTQLNSDALFRMAPDPARKYAKVADLIGSGKRVTLIYAESTDHEFEREIFSLLGSREYERYNYKYVHPSARLANSPADLSPLLENDDDNVFVIMADNEVDVDRILAALASADTNLTARGRTAPRYTVLGNARWNRYNNLDRTMFFKNRVVFVSTYHAKRDAEVVTAFDSAYLQAFGSLPSLYSYRGYDAAMIFCPAMYNDIEYDLEDRRYTPLQTTYLFDREEGSATHANRNWMRVNYHPDFTITIE